jgi:PAS domain S-box-containing protein
MSSSSPPDSSDAGSGILDALITQADRLRGGIDALRLGDAPGAVDGQDSERRWQRALWELAAHQVDDLGGRLTQLREGLSGPETAVGPYPGAPGRSGSSRPGGVGIAEGAVPAQSGPGAYGAPVHGPDGAGGRALAGRVGSAEWDLLTDEVTWSEELYQIFGRTAADGPLSLDELPSWVWSEDQGSLSTAVTACLVDGSPIDGEFRIVRPDGGVRTVHLTGEPLLDEDGGTACMWAVLRDVSELRRSEQAVRESRESLQRERYAARTEHRLAVELQQSALPAWGGPRRLPRRGGATAPGSLDLASHYLPSASGPLVGGGWYDALELPAGACLLTVGDLTGHGAPATSGMALLLGALRGMSLAGVAPGEILAHLNQLLDSATQPALGSAVCCRYEPVARELTWSQAGSPAPLLFRDGAGAALAPPPGVLLGATYGAAYGQRTERLEPGDVLVLHTDGLASRSTGPDRSSPGLPGGAGEAVPCGAGQDRLLALAPRFASASSAQECVRAVVEEFGGRDREDDACLLVARAE